MVHSPGIWGKESGVINIEDKKDGPLDEETRVNLGLSESSGEETGLDVLMPGALAILQAIQALLKFQKMLVGVQSFDCCASWQLHEGAGLHVGLGIGHHKVNGPHVPPQQQGHDENAPNCCP